MGLSFEDVELLLHVAREAGGTGTFGEQLGRVSDALSVLIPSTSLSVVVVPTTDAAGGTHAFLRGGDPRDVQLYAEHYMPHDPQAAQAAANPGVPNILSDLIPSGRWGADPFTGEFLARHNLRHLLGVMLRMPDGALLSMAIHREQGTRDFDARERELLRLGAPDIGLAAFGALVREKVGRIVRGAQPGDRAEGGVVFDAEGDVVDADPKALAMYPWFESRFPAILINDARRLASSPGVVHERVLWGPDGRGVRARSSTVDAGPRARVLTMLEPIEQGSRDHLAAVADRAGLTARERDVARLASLGLGNRHIGFKLGIATVTVGVHLTSVYRKCGVPGKNELIRLLVGDGAPAYDGA